MNFTQTDLIPEDVMLLDSYNTIFIWLGNLSTKEERRLTLETAKNYLKNGKFHFSMKNGFPVFFCSFRPSWT